MKLAIAILLCVLTLGGCSNLSPSQNTLLGGTAAGATGGAVLGAIAGNAGLGGYQLPRGQHGRSCRGVAGEAFKHPVRGDRGAEP